MELSKEDKTYLEEQAKLLSGQLRGLFNAKAREENSELIYSILYTIYERALITGIEVTVKEIQAKELRDEIIKGIIEELGINLEEQ